MILYVTQVFVMQFAGGEALQSELVEPRRHLFHARPFLHRYRLQPDGAPSHPFEVSVQLGRVRDDVLAFVLARILLRCFYSFFFFLFFFLFIRRGCGGNITFSCCFSFLFFLFLRGRVL